MSKVLSFLLGDDKSASFSIALPDVKIKRLELFDLKQNEFIITQTNPLKENAKNIVIAFNALKITIPIFPKIKWLSRLKYTFIVPIIPPKNSLMLFIEHDGV